MNILNNPILMCGLIAFGIILILVVVVIICCKRSNYNEREELKMISDEIDADLNENAMEEEPDELENVLMKMQEALETQEEYSHTFEQEQEENAIISYQELVNSLGGSCSINLDALELYDDELDNQIEISDFNKEIIDAYQNESLDREIYKFQNDFANESLQVELSEDPMSPVMNFDISEDVLDSSNVEFIDEGETYEDVVYNEVYEVKTNVVSDNLNKKFKRTEIISPVYGIINESCIVNKNIDEDIEEIVFDDFEDNAILDEF